MFKKEKHPQGAKITDDNHQFGPPNGGSSEHHSPQSVPNTKAAKTGRK